MVTLEIITDDVPDDIISIVRAMPDLIKNINSRVIELISIKSASPSSMIDMH